MLQLPIFTGELDFYITQINRFTLLTAEEEFMLAVRLKKYNDMDAARKLIVGNLRFVVKIAHEYHSYGSRLADLIQEGNIGLISAVRKFDPYKGYRLITYAVWWIRAYIQSYLIKSWSIVKIGTTQAQRKLFFKLSQAKKHLETLTKKNPEFSEIAESLGVKSSEVAQTDARMGTRDLSLNELINDDSEMSHLDLLMYDGDNQEMLLIQHEERNLVKCDIAGALAMLSDRESYIIRNRVMADTPLTLQQIGDKYKITRERARQLEKQALKKIQLALPFLEADN